MAQGKLKVKTKTPTSVKSKASKKQKGPASQRRGSESKILSLHFNSIFFHFSTIYLLNLYKMIILIFQFHFLRIHIKHNLYLLLLHSFLENHFSV